MGSPLVIRFYDKMTSTIQKISDTILFSQKLKTKKAFLVRNLIGYSKSRMRMLKTFDHIFINQKQNLRAYSLFNTEELCFRFQGLNRFSISLPNITFLPFKFQTGLMFGAMCLFNLYCKVVWYLTNLSLI